MIGFFDSLRIELAADDAKSVEMELLNARIDFRPLPGDEDGAGEYYIETRRGGVRLSVRTPGAWRSRSPRDRGGREMLRLDAAAVERLLVSDSGSEEV